VANALQLQQMLIGETRSVPESLREAYPAISGATKSSTAAQKTLF
jgi:hypothetical protein